MFYYILLLEKKKCMLQLEMRDPCTVKQDLKIPEEIISDTLADPLAEPYFKAVDYTVANSRPKNNTYSLFK